MRQQQPREASVARATGGVTTPSRSARLGLAGIAAATTAVDVQQSDNAGPALPPTPMTATRPPTTTFREGNPLSVVVATRTRLRPLATTSRPIAVAPAASTILLISLPPTTGITAAVPFCLLSFRIPASVPLTSRPAPPANQPAATPSKPSASGRQLWRSAESASSAIGGPYAPLRTLPLPQHPVPRPPGGLRICARASRQSLAHGLRRNALGLRRLALSGTPARTLLGPATLSNS